MDDSVALCLGLLITALIVLYIDIRTRTSNLSTSLSVLAAQLDAYISIQSEARTASMDALIRLGAIEKSTHSVQYIPSGSAHDFVKALKTTDDPLMADPDVDAQLEMLERKMMRAAESSIPDSI